MFKQCLAALTLLAVSAGANAAFINIVADPGSVIGGDSFSVDVVVSGLGGEPVSAYDLDVGYDAAVLSATAVTHTEAVGASFFFEAFYSDDTSVPGIVDAAGLSLLFDSELIALQGGASALTLFSIQFQAIAAGTTNLSFLFGPGQGVVGAAGQPLSVTVPGPAPVPEPGTIALLFSGLLATGLRARGRRAKA